MSGHLLTLVFLLVGAVTAQSKVHYYITPSPDIPCPNDPCLTLSQFAANSSNYTGQISLIFLPGNYTLNRELILSGADNFSMESQDNETVMIECLSQFEKFIVNRTNFIAIKGLHFIGCGENTVSIVEELKLEYTIFQGVEGEGRGTALVLNEVNFTTIIECLFESNTPGVNSQRHRVGEFIRDQGVLALLRLKQNDLLSLGGALLITSSNVSVTNTKFVFNEAKIGGVLLACKSFIAVSGCTHSYNRALYGGVMATVDSTVNLDSSNFSQNAATFEDYSRGGVIATFKGLFKITNSTFNNNNAAYSGVIHPLGGSFEITSSTLDNNSATYDGGVMVTFRGSFDIISNSFSSNSAASGGVMVTTGGSFNFTNSIFNNNSAAYGGVMVTSGGSFNITSSTFSNNEGFGGVLASTSGSFNITSSTFINNSAAYNNDNGGVMVTAGGSFNITNSNFNNNSAALGGVMVTSGGSFDITNSNFNNNSAARYGGVMVTSGGSFNITSSTFSNNEGFGGVLASTSGSFNITSSTFINNSAAYNNDNGGVMVTAGGSFNITNSNFNNNSAALGGVMVTSGGSFDITNSNFNNNSAARYGGVIYTSNGSFNITNTTFINNSAAAGGVFEISGGSFNIVIWLSTFNNNRASIGGIMYIYTFGPFNITITSSSFTNSGPGNVMYIEVINGLFDITNSSFNNNSGKVFMIFGGSFKITNSTFNNNNYDGAGASTTGGVIFAHAGSFNITDCIFDNNRADFGGVLSATGGSYNITSSSFNHNSATTYGGVMYIRFGPSIDIMSSTFTTNKANVGGVIWSQSAISTININNSSFNNNSADNYGGIMFTLQCSTHITDSTFQYNSGSLYTFNGNLTFNGKSKFKSSVEPSNKTSLTLEEGGALTSFQSTVVFNGKISLLNNRARQGGAILAIESAITLYGTTTIANNTATNSSGGGIYLQQSHLEIKGSCNVTDNYAKRGGGIHAKSSTITVYQLGGTLQFINNSADNGSGLYLEINPKLYILKSEAPSYRNLLIFTGNHARYGGAVFVADDTNSGACSPNIECFIQIYALYKFTEPDYRINTVSIQFSGNTATHRGSSLYGGLLDRCVPTSSFAEVYRKDSINLTTHYNGVKYIEDISNITFDYIASSPVRICFCDNKCEPNCSYQPPPIKVKKGETFNVSLVAVDQVNHSVEANIISSLSHDGGFSEGQQTQSVGTNCDDLTFNVFSQHDNELINLFADGPCRSSQLSTRMLHIQFLDCTCPVGFKPDNASITTCDCICDSPFITNCNIKTSSIIRENTNSWIIYVNNSDPPGYVIHPNCPFDYCQPQTVKVSINLNLPNGADAQCAYNRSRTLCGACQKHLSLSLGSSRCLPCPSHWPAVFVVILLTAIIAGILLVTAMLVLNITVAVGLINGFIFYANIVSANSAVFFPSSEPSFPTVFVAWLNLDLGIDVCFFDGLDTYIKTWLQLAFPVYIVSLVVIIIIVSEYSPKFAALIGKKDPIATLATLILLSYAKLLSITITALSFVVIRYPDGSQETVWLTDGNVKYFRGKHAALVIVALLIILVGAPYTILLLLWQWIVRAPRWKVFKWTRNTKLNAFIAAYHVPYNNKYRYWTGLLLLVRVILYITASVTVSDDPEISLLATIILVGGLFFLNRCIRNLKVYKKSVTDIVETIVYFNLLVLAAFSLRYSFKADPTEQTAVAYTSTIITFFLLIGVIAYHVYLLIKKKKTTVELKEYSLAPVQNDNSKVTQSVVEIHKPQAEADSTFNDGLSQSRDLI